MDKRARWKETHAPPVADSLLAQSKQDKLGHSLPEARRSGAPFGDKPWRCPAPATRFYPSNSQCGEVYVIALSTAGSADVGRNTPEKNTHLRDALHGRERGRNKQQPSSSQTSIGALLESWDFSFIATGQAESRRNPCQPRVQHAHAAQHFCGKLASATTPTEHNGVAQTRDGQRWHSSIAQID